MALAHLANTLATEVTSADVRADRTRFYADYARNYARLALKRSTNASGRADAPTTVRARRVSGSEARAGDNRPTIRVREFEPSGRLAWQEQKGSREWVEKLNDMADDLAQSAFLLWWKQKAKDEPISTRLAIQQAIRDWRKSERKQAFKKRCKLCKGADEPCGACERRAEEDRIAWAAAGRPTATTAETRDTLNEVRERDDINLSITDAIPAENGTSTRKQMATVIRWIMTGSSYVDIAKHLGVSEGYVRKLLRKLRAVFTIEQLLPTVGGVEAESNRTYGDRPGCNTGIGTSAYAMLADVLDREYGHVSPDGTHHTPVGTVVRDASVPTVRTEDTYPVYPMPWGSTSPTYVGRDASVGNGGCTVLSREALAASLRHFLTFKRK